MDTDQKLLFGEIRNFLAGRVLGATRDRALLEEVMKCLFARKRMLMRGKVDSSMDDVDLARCYRENFQGIKGVFVERDQLLLDPTAIRFVDDRLSQIDLLAPDRDPVGDLYEAFIGSSIRGSEGQFFTPQNAGRWLVEAVAPASGERVIDPACGAGGFLLWAVQSGGTSVKVCGIEKDEYLASLARARTAILGIDAAIYCANSLSFESEPAPLRPDEFIEQFDVVLTNPPFGKNISSVSPQTQLLFALGKKWRQDKSGRFQTTDVLASKTPPQVLFIERILSLLRQGGRAGIVVPESMLSSRSYAHVVQYIQEQSSARAVIGMPESLLKHSGKGGTHTKTCLLLLEKGKRHGKVFMAEAKWCGHDSRGRPIPKDDLPQIATDYGSFLRNRQVAFGYVVDTKALRSNILAPRYHEPTVKEVSAHLATTHELVAIQDLIDEGVLQISSGDEVGKMAYGEGDIPFVRTSDISGWEIKIDPKHRVSEDVFNRLKLSQDVRRGDILMVRDGTYLIGNCAIITEYDERIVFQSHIYKIRSLKPKVLSPYLLLALLSSDPVRRQIKAKTFTQDIIDSLGSRITELVLPIPKLPRARRTVENLVQKVIEDRVEARELARKAQLLVVDPLLS